MPNLSNVTDSRPSAKATGITLMWYENWWVVTSLVAILHRLQNFLRRRGQGVLSRRVTSTNLPGRSPVAFIVELIVYRMITMGDERERERERFRDCVRGCSAP